MYSLPSIFETEALVCHGSQCVKRAFKPGSVSFWTINLANIFSQALGKAAFVGQFKPVQRQKAGSRTNGIKYIGDNLDIYVFSTYSPSLFPFPFEKARLLFPPLMFQVNRKLLSITCEPNSFVNL
ncbi:hypothetical protein HRH25_23680 [Flavisolibacter sp. BT320]|nr:hypothetical protein [Flavisolibacter longurius]